MKESEKMDNQLNNYMDKKEAISLFLEDDDDKFYVGNIIAVDEKCFIINSITTRGYYDGFRLFFIDDLTRININGSYEKKIKLMATDSAQDKCDFDFKNNLFINILTHIQSAKKIASFGLYSQSIITGYIEDFNKSTITLNVLDEYGRDDGKTIITLDHIKQISFDSGEELILDELRIHKSPSV